MKELQETFPVKRDNHLLGCNGSPI